MELILLNACWKLLYWIINNSYKDSHHYGLKADTSSVIALHQSKAIISFVGQMAHFVQRASTWIVSLELSVCFFLYDVYHAKKFLFIYFFPIPLYWTYTCAVNIRTKQSTTKRKLQLDADKKATQHNKTWVVTKITWECYQLNEQNNCYFVFCWFCVFNLNGFWLENFLIDMFPHAQNMQIPALIGNFFSNSTLSLMKKAILKIFNDFQF